MNLGNWDNVKWIQLSYHKSTNHKTRLLCWLESNWVSWTFAPEPTSSHPQPKIEICQLTNAIQRAEWLMICLLSCKLSRWLMQCSIRALSWEKERWEGTKYAKIQKKSQEISTPKWESVPGLNDVEYYCHGVEWTTFDLLFYYSMPLVCFNGRSSVNRRDFVYISPPFKSRESSQVPPDQYTRKQPKINIFIWKICQKKIRRG